jgi:hypothetical protein
MIEAMKDPAFVKRNGELQRNFDNEQKLLEAADREKASSSARAGTRDHLTTSEENKKETIVKKEEDNDVGHGRNESTEAQGLRIEPGSAFDLDVGILRCMDCRFDKTVSSHQAGYCYSSFTEHDEHHRSGYHSRAMRSFRRAEGQVVRNKAKCCGGFWTAEEFVGHLAEKHPDL